MTEIPKKVALVTGGAQGIGRAIAQRFLRDGFAVCIADADAEACAEMADASAPLITQVCEVSREDDVRKAVDACTGRFGRLDVLVCNAGISAPRVPVEEQTFEQWQRVIGVNLSGCFLGAKHAVPHLKKTRGCIINIASTRAQQSEANTEPYSASKGGIVALTHALSVSLGPAVRVNCISPGWIETGDWKKHGAVYPIEHSDQDRLQHPAGRVGVPEDIAGMATYLASPDAGFITGQNFVVDGGMTTKMIYAE